MTQGSPSSTRRPSTASSASLQPPSPSSSRRQSLLGTASLHPGSPSSTRRQSTASAVSLHPNPPASTRRQSISSTATFPPTSSSSSSTLVANTTPTTIPAKPNNETLIPASYRTLKELIRTSLRKRIHRQLTRFVHTRPSLPAPILSTTLAFILLHDINGNTTCPPPLKATDVNVVSETRWSKLWIPSNGQLATHMSSGVRESLSSDLCALASVTQASALNKTLKHWLLCGCTDRWPVGEPLLPLDVIASVYSRLSKYSSCAAVQRAIEKKLARRQAVDFALVAAHVRSLVELWPEKAIEIVGEWALVVTRLQSELDRVVEDISEEEKRQATRMCVEVFRAAVDETSHGQSPA
ncbi:hypothetical protein BCR44DRAFT_411502 [Catenaria anguillulae PL171]|uniref:Uncharacterized protein n=1 Tax=Catenaria anguillulae PL171 TaxID=765915 RepID=A0A1Y2I087_9FUNG|nr:hypothetical protein BCR44DRAFT_411502 [Catenaria anguillulae PL171]